MISPKEISEKKFEKIGKGYRVEEVDTYLKEVAFSIANMTKTFDDNEAKIEKLVDKINEYREEEDTIKAAILGAQKQAKQIILEAEIESQKIIANAKDKSEALLYRIKDEYSDELAKLENLKKEVSLFKSQLTDLYNKQLHLIMDIPEFSDDSDSETDIQIEINKNNFDSKKNPANNYEDESESFSYNDLNLDNNQF